MPRYLAAAIAAVALAAGLMPAAGAKPPKSHDGDDVTVIAVIDSGITPYHWDFLAAKMPKSIDVPLNRPPHEWLRGFPSPSTFSGYDALDLTFETKNDVSYQQLHAADRDEWQSVKQSTKEDVNYYWIPGTKIIGAVDFGTDQIYGDTDSHGTGASSVAVGNLHGSCAECLLVFIDTGGFNQQQTEAALE